MENNEIILSICIPTYNNGKKLLLRIEDFLLTAENRFEIVVCDNSSTDGNLEQIKDIKDSRLKIIENEKNIGSIPNAMKSLASGNGKYVMFLTDKDFVKMQNIEKILNILEKNNFAVGYFNLDSNKQVPDIKIYDKGKKALFKLGYSSKHPSGFFYNNSLLKTIDIEKNFSDMEKVGGFPFDFIAASLSLLGNGAVIDVGFCYTTSPPFDGMKHSLTYSPTKDNVFWFPKQRFITFEQYVKHLQTLDIDKRLYNKKFKMLVKSTKNFCTKGYRNILLLENICNWYNVESRKLSEKEYNNIKKDFYMMLKQSEFFSSFIEKYIFIIKHKLNEFFKRIAK